MKHTLLLAMALGCAPSTPARCPDADLAVIVAECAVVVAQECGTPARKDCPAKAECHRRINAWNECK